MSYSNVNYLPVISLQKPPQQFRSYYIGNLDNMRELGRIRGDQNASLSTPITDLAVLFMGEPQSYAGDIYGVLLLNWNTAMYVYNSDVRNGVQEFVRGYLEGSARNPSSTLNIVVAVNTSGIWINQEHGKSWGDMIEYLNYDWLPTQSGYSQIHIYGGLDVEPGAYPDFNPPPVVQNWLRGYATVDQNHRQQYRRLYALAAASECLDAPDKYTTSGSGLNPASCGTHKSDNVGNMYNWTQEDLYQLTWGFPYINAFPDIYPIPQIYGEPYDTPTDSYSNGFHARQWYKIALYTYLKHIGIKMYFSGVITQQAACDSKKTEGNTYCFDQHLYNSRDNALQYLRNELLTDPYGRMNTDVAWKTDVGYYLGQP